MHLNAYLFILSKVALIYFVTEKKTRKNGRMTLEMSGFARIYTLSHDTFASHFAL